MTGLLWNLLLFLLKFALIGLIYWVLLSLLRVVRQEMSLRLESRAPETITVPGRLRVVDPGGDATAHPGQVILLRPETPLGADPENTVTIHDPYVSGHHARMSWDGAGWWIEDLGSRNGTFVNQAQIPPHTLQPVPAGAWIQVGGMSLTLFEE